MGRTQPRRAVNDRSHAVGFNAPLIPPERVLREALRLIDREGRIDGFSPPAPDQVAVYPKRKVPDWEPSAFASVWLKLPVRGGRVMVTVEYDKRDDRIKFYCTDINSLQTPRMVSGGEPAEIVEDCAEFIVAYTEQRIRSNNPTKHLNMSRHPSLPSLYIVLDDINALLSDDTDEHESDLLAERCREIDVPDDEFAKARYECQQAIRAGRGDLRKERRAIEDFRDYAEMRIARAGRSAVSDFDARMAAFKASKREGNPGGHSTGMVIAAGVGGFVVGAMVTGAAYNAVVVKPMLRRVIELQMAKQPGTV
jgi:hypothetical protein